MIKIQKLEIEEFRGIRALTIDMKGKNFAVCGPNGTGKSGIVDALEFALTGNISRLAGKGTGGLSVKEHGPHVDSRNRPDKARVVLHVHMPTLGVDAIVERTVKDAKKPKITPNAPDVKAVFASAEAHPEFVLSRREIIQYILSEPGKRSKEVQALLRLDQVEALRMSLQKIANACDRDLTSLGRLKKQASDGLCRSLGLTQPAPANILAAANAKRTTLGLPTLTELTTATSIKDGLVTSAAADKPQRIAKKQAAGDAAALKALLSESGTDKFTATKKGAVDSLTALGENPLAADGVQREALLRSAIALFDDKECPVCAIPWSADEFRAVVTAKLKTYDAAATQRAEAEKLLQPIIEHIERFRDALDLGVKCGKQITPQVAVAALGTFSGQLKQQAAQLEKFLPIADSLAAIEAACAVPPEVGQALIELEKAVNALPEPSVQEAARDFLSAGQERLEAYRDASLALKAAEERSILAKSIYETYVATSTSELDGIYKTVEKQFSEYYRFINKDDEATFEARLTPSMARLAFDVDFYGRGFFPPGAYHSEGHQDGMGLCLYLALMKHLLGDTFCLAVLDDVVMSVDAGHRREVCKLLKEKFPNTQFVLTTHDEIWLRQMGSAGLIEPKAFIQFRRWDVSHGPIEWTDKDIWEEIAGYLRSNDVRSAAGLLRYFLEYFSREVCDQIRARVEFRGDGRYELGDLLPPAISRMRDLIKKSKSAAQSWGDYGRVTEIEAFEAAFVKDMADSEVEKWPVNPAVHYNEWANFGKGDFEPVVEAYKRLIGEFRCGACGMLLYLSVDGFELDALRCGCAKMNLNLKPKPAPKK
jgi:RecF/RecN/SMC N terminal domain